jgi:hypothetical protein
MKYFIIIFSFLVTSSAFSANKGLPDIDSVKKIIKEIGKKNHVEYYLEEASHTYGHIDNKAGEDLIVLVVGKKDAIYGVRPYEQQDLIVFSYKDWKEYDYLDAHTVVDFHPVGVGPKESDYLSLGGTRSHTIILDQEGANDDYINYLPHLYILTQTNLLLRSR